MSWLILGGNGQLGRALSEVLQERQIEFCAWGRQELDITSGINCFEKINALMPTVIVNAAAWTDVDGAESNQEAAHTVNVIGTMNLSTSAKSIGAVFVHISTDYVFSGESQRPWSEHDLLAPVSVYGKTKAASEMTVSSQYGEYSYIFRTAWLYSKWGKNFAKTMTRMAKSNDEEVRVVSDQFGQPTSALDLANQIVEAVSAELPFGIYHATNSGQASWFDFAKEIFEASGASTGRLVPVASTEYPRPAKRPTYSVLGHDAWLTADLSTKSVSAMQNWKIALHKVMPDIISATNAER